MCNHLPRYLPRMAGRFFGAHWLWYCFGPQSHVNARTARSCLPWYGVFIFIFCHACQVFEGVVLEGGGDFFGGLRWLIIFFCLVFIFNSQDALAFSHKVAASEAQSFGSGAPKDAHLHQLAAQWLLACLAWRVCWKPCLCSVSIDAVSWAVILRPS